MAWPESLTRNATATWKIALDLASRWPWVADLFGDVGIYQAALYAYYLSLSVLEYSDLLRLNNGKVPSQEMWPDVPPVFEETSEEVRRAGYRMLIDQGEEFLRDWAVTGIDEAIIKREWNNWSSKLNGWLQQLRPFPFFGGVASFSRLIPEVTAKPRKG